VSTPGERRGGEKKDADCSASGKLTLVRHD
jgi:hypothetical protein